MFGRWAGFLSLKRSSVDSQQYENNIYPWLFLVALRSFSSGHVEHSPRNIIIFQTNISIEFLNTDFTLSSVVQSMKPSFIGSQCLAVSVWKIDA